MVKFTCENGNTNMALMGCPLDITADVMLMLTLIYERFKEQDEETAEMFYDCLEDNLSYIKDRNKLFEDVDAQKEKFKEEIDLLEKEIDKIKKHICECEEEKEKKKKK